jgi:hypothetical protein
MHRNLHAVIGAFATAAVAAAIAGCGGRDAVEPTKSGGDQPPATSPSSPPAVELAQVRYDALADAIQKQKGNVVIIDMWATW